MMKRSSIIIVLMLVTCSVLGFSVSAREYREMVLVTATGSTIPKLSKKEIRRLYLGKKVKINGAFIDVINNRSDDLLHEVFLQKFIFMSSRTYHRLLVAKILRHGGNKPAEYLDKTRLANALKSNPQAISYMWRTTATQLTDVKISQTLWQGTLD